MFVIFSALIIISSLVLAIFSAIQSQWIYSICFFINMIFFIAFIEKVDTMGKAIEKLKRDDDSILQHTLDNERKIEELEKQVADLQSNSDEDNT